jgi:hypothetical protein
MANVRTISQEDLDKYPSLKGKQVGDTITAQEDYELRRKYAKENGETFSEPINPDTGITGTSSSIDGVEGEPAGAVPASKPSRSTRSGKK